MKPVYTFTTEVKGKPVEFIMQADESLKVVHRIDDITASKWRKRLQAAVNYIYGITTELM